MTTNSNDTEAIEAVLQKAQELSEKRLRLQLERAHGMSLQLGLPENMEADLKNQEKEAWAEAVMYCKDNGITTGLVADYLAQMRQADPELFCRITILAGIEDVYLGSNTSENVIEWD